MKKTFILISLELKILCKDRQAIGLLFIMPTALIFFLTLALKDVYLAKVGSRSPLQVVTGTTCNTQPMCLSLLEQLKKFDYDLQITNAAKEPYSTPVTLIFPENIAQSVEFMKSEKTLADVNRVQLIFDPALDHSFRALVQGNLLAALQSVLIEEVRKDLQAIQLPRRQTAIRFPKVIDVGHFQGLVEEKAWGGAVLPNPIQQMVPAWALFGMFFIVIPLSNSVIRDRRLGVFKRLLSFPVSRGHLLAGKIIPFFLINLIQFALMFLLGIFILPSLTGLHLPMDFNGWGLVLVTAICALTSTSYGLMISSLCKTSEQASAFGSLSVVILAVLGGIMVPSFVMPAFMQKLSGVSPLYWGLQSYLDLLVRKLSLESLILNLAVLGIFSLAFILVAAISFRWSEVD